MSIYDDFMRNKTNPSAGNVPNGGSIYERFMAGQYQEQPEPVAQQPEESWTDKAYNLAAEVGSNLMAPAAAALDVINWFDKPRGAIAGAVKAYQDDSDIVEGAKKGFSENTSYKENLPKEFQKEDPYYAASLLGFGLDVALDPMLVATPAKIVKGLVKGSKALGLTDAIMPTVNAVKNSERGQKAIAWTEDALGLNNQLSSAKELADAAKGEYLGATKDALKYTEKIIKEELPNANRQEVEAIAQRMVESYPDIGKFARAGDEVASRDYALSVFQKEIDNATQGVNRAKINLDKVGQLTDEEAKIEKILQESGLGVDDLGRAVNSARQMGEIPKAVPKMAKYYGDNARIQEATAKAIKEGYFPESQIDELRGLFNSDELKELIPTLKQRFKNNPALVEIERMAFREGSPIANPSSRLEADAISRVGRSSNMVLDANPNIAGMTTPNVSLPNKITGLVDVSLETQKYIESLRAAGVDVNRYVDDIQKEIDGIIKGEVDYLASSGGKGVDQGTVIFDLEGNAVGRVGRMSNNPQWYRDFYNKTGRAPRKGELQELAIKRLNEGFEESGHSVPPNEVLQADRNLLQATKEARRGMPDQAEWYGTAAESSGKAAHMNNPSVMLDSNVSAKLSDVNLNANVPDLMQQAAIKSEKVLPNPVINGRKVDTINIPNLSDDGRILLASVNNVPELAQKIKTQKELAEQTSALEKAKQAMQKADISPEKTTQVIDDALKRGYTPSEVEGIFKISERMREVNQMFTDAAAKRTLIPEFDAKSFSGGRHLRRMYSALENPEEHYNNLIKMGYQELADKFWTQFSRFEGEMKAKGVSINTATFDQRKNMPKEMQDQLGRLYEATFPFAKGNKIAAEQFAKYDFLKEVSQKYGSREMKPGYRKVPITEDGKYGQLEGMFLPDRVFQKTLYEVSRSANEATSFEKWIQRWKAGKLINPASFNRNFLSGIAQSNVFGNVPIHKFPQVFAETVTDMKHATDRFFEARKAGVFEASLSRKDVEMLGNRIRGNDVSALDKVDNVLSKGMEIYSIPDNFWRMFIYNHARNSGKEINKAKQLATRAMFDYSNAPAWLESLSRKGWVPFGKFPFFAAKETARALYEKPAAVTKFIKPQNQVNNEDREKIMPDYLKSRTLLPIGQGTRMVNGKPQKVQNNIDLSYLIPFANDVSVGNPITDAITLATTGRNGLGQQVIKEGLPKENAKAVANFAANAFAPAVLSPYSWGKLVDGFQGNVDSKGRQYDATSAVSQVILGLRNVPISTDEQFRSKIGSITREQNNVKSLMNDVGKNRNMTKEQKLKIIKQHGSQLKELGRMKKETQEAYKREKRREAN